jgi:hypothetical protein
MLLLMSFGQTWRLDMRGQEGVQYRNSLPPGVSLVVLGLEVHIM